MYHALNTEFLGSHEEGKHQLQLDKGNVQVLLRDLFILQVVRLVLTYNFSNCNFEEISNIYSEAIFPDLKEYLNGRTFNQIEVCDNLVSRVVSSAGFPREWRASGKGVGEERQAELQDRLPAEPIGDLWAARARLSLGGAGRGGSPSSRRSRLPLPGPSLLGVDSISLSQPRLWILIPDSFVCLPFLSPSPFLPPSIQFFNFWRFLCSLNSAACEQTDCLMKIEYHTLNPIPGCPSLPQKTFALKTKGALISQCPGYSETQRNNPQEMKQEVENICLNQTSQIQWLWFMLRQTPV
nr:thymic stromal lymphopoietin [Peromyscus maniculatus bairdii]